MNSCWICVDGDGNEFAFGSRPDKGDSSYKFYKTCFAQGNSSGDKLEKGTIRNLIGKDMVFDDEPLKTTFSEVRTAEWKLNNQYKDGDK
jgi:hypothetical protein